MRPLNVLPIFVESSFLGAATKVIKSFEDILEQRIAAIAALGVTLTASAVETKSTWPYVTLHDFQQRSTSTQSLSGSFFTAVLPIITKENRLDWEAYSIANWWWVTEGQDFQLEKDLGNKETIALNSSYHSPSIYAIDSEFPKIFDANPRKYGNTFVN